MSKLLKQRIYEIIEIPRGKDGFSKTVNIFIILLILLNVIAVILESYNNLATHYHIFFYYFEIVSVTIFSIEYLLRVYSCTSESKYQGVISGRLKYAIKPMLLIDLFAILPFFIPLFLGIDLRILRTIRVFRIIRILKLSRYFESMRALAFVFKTKSTQIGMTLLGVMVLLIMSSSIMYFLEKDIQPDAFPNIPTAMWWGVATLTTVGYGDVFPVTALGKIFGAIISILGIGLFALPAGILGSGFIEYLQNKTQVNKCPHCGKDIHKF